MVQHANTHTSRRRDCLVPGPPKIGITITEWKREEKEEISLFGNGRAPPWSSAALDHLPGAGCRTTAQPQNKSDHYFWDGDDADYRYNIFVILHKHNSCKYKLMFLNANSRCWRKKKNQGQSLCWPKRAFVKKHRSYLKKLWKCKYSVDWRDKGASCYIWCKTNTAFHEKSSIPIVWESGGSVMVWSCFAA